MYERRSRLGKRTQDRLIGLSMAVPWLMALAVQGARADFLDGLAAYDAGDIDA